MNDCLAATGSTGIDPLIGAIALLIVGVGIAALIWRNHKRGAMGIALLPLVLGILVFGNVSATPAQAAECPPPPPACVAEELESIVFETPVEILIEDVGDATTIELDGLTDADLAIYQEFLFNLAEIDENATGWVTVVFGSGEPTVTLYADEDGTILSADPALPDPFDEEDVWDLIADTLEDATDVPGVTTLGYDYDNGCGAATVTVTINGTWDYPEVPIP